MAQRFDSTVALTPDQLLKKAIRNGEVIENDRQYHCMLCARDLKTIGTIKNHLTTQGHQDKKLSEDMKKLSISNEEGNKQKSQTSEEEFQHDQNLYPELQPYSVTSNPRGYVLVFNCFVGGTDTYTRKGAEHDSEGLEDIFKKLGYKVKVHENLTADQIYKEIDKIQNKELEKVDSLIMFFLSHGQESFAFFGEDNKPVELPKIWSRFTDSNCKFMKKKPKIIFTNFCRGNYDEILERDGVAKDIPRDLVNIYASTEGFTAKRNKERGTAFVMALCKVLRKHATTLDLRDIYILLDSESKKEEGTQPKWEDFRFRKFHFVLPHSST